MIWTSDARPVRVRVTTAKVVAGLQAGDPVRLRATLQPPSGPALPGGYDFARHAWFDQLGAVGYTWTAPKRDTGLGTPPLSLRLWAHVERLRRAIGGRITAALPGETGAIANALITGERGGIPEETTNAFRDSGLLHILSISGLHMAIMAGSVFFLVRLMLAAVPAIALRYPIKKWAAVVAMLGAVAYLLISGSSFATVRSTIMISIMFLAVLLDRPALALRNVVLAAILILIVFPESLLDVGFQMSFAAVVALISVYEAFARRGGWSLFPQGPVGEARFLLRRHRAVDACCERGDRAVCRLPLPQEPAVRRHRQPHRHAAVQPCRHAGGAGDADLDAARARGGGALGDGVGDRWHAVDGPARGWPARRRARTSRRFRSRRSSSMVAGGLWLALWQTRWRLLGVALIACGLALAPAPRLPDLLVGRDGDLVAVREDDGRLAAVGRARDTYELSRWLEHDGDGRAPRAAKGRHVALRPHRVPHARQGSDGGGGASPRRLW